MVFTLKYNFSISQRSFVVKQDSDHKCFKLCFSLYKKKKKLKLVFCYTRGQSNVNKKGQFGSLVKLSSFQISFFDDFWYFWTDLV